MIYSNVFHVCSVDGLLVLTVRTTENRVDSFSFSSKEIKSLCNYMGEEDLWIGDGKLSIRVGQKSRVRINKSHATVTYAIGQQDARILLAQIESIYTEIKDISPQEESIEDSSYVANPDTSSILSLIEEKLAQHRQILLSEIDMRLARLDTPGRTPLPSSAIHTTIEEYPTQTFIPSKMGSTLKGKLQTKEEKSEIDVSSATKKLKSLKDT